MLCVICSYFMSVNQNGGPDVALVGYIMEGTEVELANSKYHKYIIENSMAAITYCKFFLLYSHGCNQYG